MTRAERPSVLLWAILGFLVWASAFAALHGTHAVTCPDSLWMVEVLGMRPYRALLAGLWLLHLAIVIWLLAAGRRRFRATDAEPAGLDRFAYVLVVFSTIAAAVATFWIGFPVVLLSTC